MPLHGRAADITAHAETAFTEIAADVPMPIHMIEILVRERETIRTVNVNDIKRHIHVELFERNIFPSSHDNLKSIEEIKGHWKEETLLRSIRIMRNHNQTNTDIRGILENKFFLDKETINRILEKEKQSNC